MGLDNGIRMYFDKKRLKSPLFRCLAGSLLSELDIDLEKEKPNVDVCYWRRYYNIREDILRELNLPTHGGSYILNSVDIKNIIKVLSGYTKENWVVYGFNGAPEEWDEPVKDGQKLMLKHDIYRLKRLLRLEKIYGVKLLIIFYDSY